MRRSSVVTVPSSLYRNADPATVNSSPEEGGWFFKIKLSNKSELSQLMTPDKYADYVKGL